MPCAQGPETTTTTVFQGDGRRLQQQASCVVPASNNSNPSRPAHPTPDLSHTAPRTALKQTQVEDTVTKSHTLPTDKTHTATALTLIGECCRCSSYCSFLQRVLRGSVHILGLASASEQRGCCAMLPNGQGAFSRGKEMTLRINVVLTLQAPPMPTCWFR